MRRLSAQARSGGPEPQTVVRQHAVPLRSDTDVPDAIVDLVGDAWCVLLGESTHGTHEFYRMRAAISRRLIEEKGFSAIAVEADWPDAYRVNRFIRGMGSDGTPEAALDDFQRFPQWMWANTEITELVAWLRSHNEDLPISRRVGFYGLDLYSLYGSIRSVIEYLERVDPDAAEEARNRYACFDHRDEDAQRYGLSVHAGMRESCEREAVEQLVRLRERAAERLRRDGLIAEEEEFFAEQNARVVRGAEEYYRTMFGGRVSSWNLRDRHMHGTLTALREHLSRSAVPGGGPSKIVVWAHNSHLGDARATDMARRGELNLGQLAREHDSDGVISIGLTTSMGTVSAATDWDGPVHRKHIRRPSEGTYERVFHDAGVGRFFLPVAPGVAADGVAEALTGPRPERFIGVIYRPQTERLSHYFDADLPRQFDAVIHFDESRALRPLRTNPAWESRDAPETYPAGL